MNKKDIKKTNTVKQEMDKGERIVLPSPKEIKAYLDQFVIGQDDAKKVLSVAVHNHYRRIFNNGEVIMKKNGVLIDKSNIMLMGETGSGKTYMIRKIAELLDVPCYIQDCTNITESGYVGNDVENCLTGLLRSCNYNIGMAQYGIVVLDEVDKITSANIGTSLTKDVGGVGVQQSLLKIVESDLVGVPPMGGRKHPHEELIYVDTTNILFIATGAFVGIDKIIKRRLGGTTVGYSVSEKGDIEERDNIINYVTAQDVKEFGMIPEFVGRFPVITHVNRLTEDDMVSILTKPNNSLVSQYIELMRYENVKLSFDEKALRKIAEYALRLKTGARGLRNIMETVMLDIMFEVPGSSYDENVLVTEEYVDKQLRKKYFDLVA